MFTVIPSGPSSRASVFDQPTTPGRTAFESARLSIGSRTDEDSIATIAAVAARTRWGRQWRRSRTCEVSSSVDGLLDALVRRARSRLPAGGPPELWTTMSMPPKAPDRRLDEPLEVLRDGHVAADGERAEPVRLALEHVAAPREHRDVRALSASASAMPSPMPDEAPQTIAVRPVSPRSIGGS